MALVRANGVRGLGLGTERELTVCCRHWPSECMDRHTPTFYWCGPFFFDRGLDLVRSLV